MPNEPLLNTAPAAGAPAAGAPAEYAAFTLPEGVKLDAEVLAEFGKTAKGLNLTQEAAQGAISQLATSLNTRGVAIVEQNRADMLAAAKADKAIGGDNFNRSVGLAQLAIEADFAPEFKKFLNESGLGNHPEMIRGLMKRGQQLAPDGWVPGTTQPANTAGDARVMYPNSKMNA